MLNEISYNVTNANIYTPLYSYTKFLNRLSPQLEGKRETTAAASRREQL